MDRSEAPRESVPRRMLVPLVLASGAAGLIYQQVWIRWLIVLFGATAPAVATAVAAFFTGLATGALAARRWPTAPPLVAYAVCEASAAVGALGVLALREPLAAWFPTLYTALGGESRLLVLVRVGITFLLLLPATVAMGAALPFLVRLARGARIANRWYAVNTAGAAIGAALTGLWLPVAIGVRGTYLVALALSLSAAVGALWSHRTAPAADRRALPEPGRPTSRCIGPSLGSATILPLAACLSGAASLGLEVLWTRLWAQVLPNSTISFTLVLLLFISAWSLAPLIASRWLLPRLPGSLALVAALAAIATWCAPALFRQVTGGLAYVPSHASLAAFIGTQLRVGALAFGAAVLLGGMILPCLWSLEWSAGAFSRVLFWNLLGGAAGSLVVGLGGLGTLGMERSNVVAGALFAAIAVLALPRTAPRRRVLAGLAAGAATLSLLLLPRAPLLSRSRAADEQVLDWREGAEGIVVATRKGPHLRLRLDNHYLLGSSESRENEERQAHLPLLLHPRPRSVAFLGGGTGITAGAALLHPVEEVTLVELVPEVLDLARRWFREECHGLYDDPRVRTVVGDARHVLASEEHAYDVIVSDLYVPWHRGAGYLYSADFFAIARQRLAPRGIFCQWIPLYQLSVTEFLRIVATADAVFEDVQLFRGDFYADRPIVSVVCRATTEPLSLGALPVRTGRLRERGVTDGLAATEEGVVMQWLASSRHLDLPRGIHSDNWPRIEFRAALDQARGRSSIRGAEWVELCRQAQARSIPEASRALGPLSESAGRALRSAPILLDLVHHRLEGRLAPAMEAAGRLRELLPERVFRTALRRVPRTPEEIRTEVERLRREMDERIRAIETAGGETGERGAAGTDDGDGRNSAPDEPADDGAEP